MKELEVNCIQRPEGRAAQHYTITHLGHLGYACRMPVELAITQIRGGLHRFYTLDPSTQAKVYIGVRREAGRCPYLQAHIDDVWTDHLLALPDCGRNFRLIQDGQALGCRQAVRFLVQR